MHDGDTDFALCFMRALWSCALVLGYYQARAHLTRTRLLPEVAFTKLFDATQYNAENTSYRLSDTVRGARQSPW